MAVFKRTCVPLDEVLERDGHLFLHGAGGVDMAGDVEEFCARVSLSAKTQEPRAAPTANSGRHGYSLHVSNGCRAAKHTCMRTKQSERD